MLKNAQIAKLAPKEKPYLLADTEGLYLEVRPNGTKTFYLIFQLNGRRKKITIGKWGDALDLTAARLKAIQTRQNYTEKEASAPKAGKVADEWLALKEKEVTDEVFKDILSIVERVFVKHFKFEGTDGISRARLIDAILKEFAGKNETERRALGHVRRIFNYALARGYTQINPLLGIAPDEIFGKKIVKNYPTITGEDGLRELFTRILNSRGAFSVKAALCMGALTALRVGNLCDMKWANVDFENEWLYFSADEMKARRDFVLPLNSQALNTLKWIYAHHRVSEWVFFSETGSKGHIPRESPRALLRHIGYTNEQFTPHGFRAAFSTIANEKGQSSEIVELCLAHAVGGVKGVYDRSRKVEQKRELMQWWGDYLAPLSGFERLFRV